MKQIEVNEKTFKDYQNFCDWLKVIDDVTEWRRVNSDVTLFEPFGDGNPFPALGGDEYGVSASFDAGFNKVPFRHTALASVIARADITGKGIQRVFEADKDIFCRHLNEYYSLKPKKEMLALIQDGKLSALHSGNYSIIPLGAIYDCVNEYLRERCTDVDICNCYWSWEISQVDIEINDEYFNGIYQKYLSKYLDSISNIKLRVISSDVADSAVRVIPYILSGKIVIPLAGVTATRHYGEADISAVKKGLNKTFLEFDSSFRQLAGLADIRLNNKKNVMIKAFSYLRFPQKYAAELCEWYQNTPTNALDVYTSMTEVFDRMKSKLKTTDIMRYEEIFTKLIMFNQVRWEKFDVSGTVAWSAREN